MISNRLQFDTQRSRQVEDSAVLRRKTPSPNYSTQDCDTNHMLKQGFGTFRNSKTNHIIALIKHRVGTHVVIFHK